MLNNNSFHKDEFACLIGSSHALINSECNLKGDVGNQIYEMRRQKPQSFSFTKIERFLCFAHYYRPCMRRTAWPLVWLWDSQQCSRQGVNWRPLHLQTINLITTSWGPHIHTQAQIHKDNDKTGQFQIILNRIFLHGLHVFLFQPTLPSTLVNPNHIRTMFTLSHLDLSFFISTCISYLFSMTFQHLVFDEGIHSFCLVLAQGLGSIQPIDHFD